MFSFKNPEKLFFLATLSRLAFETPEEAAAAAAKAKADADANASKGVTFTPEQQEHINNIIAKEKRTKDEAIQKAVEEAQALKVKADLTAKDKQDVETRLEQLLSSTKTQEQLRADREAKVVKEKEAAQKAAEESAKTWEARYKQEKISNAIYLGSKGSNYEAKNPAQLTKILASDVRVEEEFSDDNKPKGTFVVMAKIEVSDAAGVKKQLDLPVGEAIKKLAESADYSNLFTGSGVGGFGGSSSSASTGKIDGAELARKDPAKYLELRKAGKIDAPGD